MASVECPKCGFVQPKDQYCASCGVDMVSYAALRPKAGGANWSVIIPGIIFAASTVLAIGLIVERRARLHATDHSVAHSVSARGVLDPNARSAGGGSEPAPKAQQANVSSKGSSELANNKAAGSHPPAAKPGAERGERDFGTAARLSGVPGNPQGALAVADRALSDEPSGSGASRPSTGKSAQTGFVEPEQASRVWLLFTKVTQVGLSELKSQSQGVSTDGLASFGYLDQMEAKLRDLADVKQLSPLETGSRFDLRTGEMISVSKGKRDEVLGQLVGLTLQLMPGAPDRQGTALQFDSVSTAKEASGALSDIAHRVQLNIPKGHGAWVAGLLARKPVPPEQVAFYSSHPVLRLVTDPDFQSGQVEFVLFVQPR